MDIPELKKPSMINLSVDEIVKANQNSFEITEIIPGHWVILKEKPPSTALATSFQPEPSIHLSKLAFPINGNKTFMFASQDINSRSLKNMIGNTTDLANFSQSNLFDISNLKLPEFSMDSLNVSTFTEKFQEFTQKIKSEWEKVTNKSA